MTKTQCDKCMFSDTVSSDNPCEFNIPNKIKDVKTLSIKDDFYEIENYRCLYGFSTNQYNQNIENFKQIDIHDFIKEKASIKYYAIIDTRRLSEQEFLDLIKSINNLPIKPRYCSIIVNPNNPDLLYQHIRNNLICHKWTIHVFIEALSFNDCINIILDTNLVSAESWCVLFLESHKLQPMTLNNLINEIQDTFIIKQKSFHGINKDSTSLHMLCLNCSVYKALVSTIDKDILKAINITPEVILEKYESS